MNTIEAKQDKSASNGSVIKGDYKEVNTKTRNGNDPKSATWCEIHKSKSHSTQDCRLFPDLQAQGYNSSKNKKCLSVVINKTSDTIKKDRDQIKANVLANQEAIGSLTISNDISVPLL